MSILSMDGKFYKSCVIVYKLMIVNFFIVVFSLGIITISASTAAAFYTIDKTVISGDEKIFKTFYSSFKGNFLKSLPLFVFFIFSLLFCRVLYMQFFGINLVVNFLYCVIALFVLSVNFLNHMVLGRIEMTIFNVFKYSLFLNFVYILLSIVTGLICILILLVLEKISLLLLILFGASIPVYIYSKFYKERILYFLKK